MNLFLLGIIIFVIVYLFLNWFAGASSKKIALTIKKIAVYISLALAAILTLGGKYLFSLPFLFVILMTVLSHGANKLMLIEAGPKLPNGIAIEELIDADDTLLIDSYRKRRA